MGFAAGHQFGLVIDRYHEIRLCDLVVIVLESRASQPASLEHVVSPAILGGS
jgi:hypothetical protein